MLLSHPSESHGCGFLLQLSQGASHGVLGKIGYEFARWLHNVFIVRHCPMSQCRTIKMSDSLDTHCNVVGVCAHACLDVWMHAGSDRSQFTVAATRVRAWGMPWWARVVRTRGKPESNLLAQSVFRRSCRCTLLRKWAAGKHCLSALRRNCSRFDFPAPHVGVAAFLVCWRPVGGG